MLAIDDVKHLSKICDTLQNDCMNVFTKSFFATGELTWLKIWG